MTERIKIELGCDRCPTTAIVDGAVNELGVAHATKIPRRWSILKVTTFGEQLEPVETKLHLCADCTMVHASWLQQRDVIGCPLGCAVAYCPDPRFHKSIWCERHTKLANETAASHE